MAKKKRNKKGNVSVIIFVLLVFISVFINVYPGAEDMINDFIRKDKDIISIDEVPEYSGLPFVEINGNKPVFDEIYMTEEPFEIYSDLDILGRCGTAFACVCRETMPEEEREPISSVTPTGFINKEYDFIDQGYVYNRCHLIGFQLTGENANEKNLITGTRYMNIEGMLPIENKVADHVDETGDHVLYRVTPVFDGLDLVAKGVQIEALSVEDNGKGLQLNVFVYNVQPGVDIDYKTGETEAADGMK